MKHYVSKSAQCPFYHHEEPQRVSCEGVEHGTGLRLSFDTREHHEMYKKTFCNSGDWAKCRVARMLEAKYDSN